MLLGVVYDLGMSLTCLVFPRWFAGRLGLSVLQGAFGLYLLSLVHLVLACFGVLAWMDIKRNIVIVTGAILARLVYAVFMLGAVWQFSLGPAWAVGGVISLALALSHYVFLRLSDFGFWDVIRRAGNPPGLRRR
jgi:hypothetical protein